jgi:hypothetical protein
LIQNQAAGACICDGCYTWSSRGCKIPLEAIQGPVTQPFRQFSEITVHDMVQAVALNAANPVLCSYDIVAMRPKNQKAFNQTCTHLEVKKQKSSKDKRSSHTPLNSSSQNSQPKVFAATVLKSVKFTNYYLMVGWRNANYVHFLSYYFSIRCWDP